MHGMHILMKALNTLIAQNPDFPDYKNISVRFLKPLYLSESLILTAKATSACVHI